MIIAIIVTIVSTAVLVYLSFKDFLLFLDVIERIYAFDNEELINGWHRLGWKKYLPFSGFYLRYKHRDLFV